MSLLVPLQFACLTTFGLLLMAAAWQDLRTVRIADAFSLGIVAAFAVWALGGLAADSTSLSKIGLAVGCAAAVFALGALGFAIGVLGGGDVKLLAAASLFAGPVLLVDFLMVTAMTGGLLGLAMLAGARIGPATPAGDAPVSGRLRSGLPYGPAIAAGGLWVAAALVAS
jgi:prepilin peptidase CpaA